MQTSKIFMDRFNCKRESIKSEEEGTTDKQEKGPRSLIQLPHKFNGSGFTSFWSINKEETG